ncbi:ABC transporter ATP-binding protein [Parafilimonas terrae]|uniref:Lipopolysaccharide transport system ATP-binding protein n=1 Tax=Parafilimonas terrae TaxID=1465490 RepID=A0A1I5WG84_9BACT|nr:ABC transporter ATP-binding protein [Parafilimonas terrae]SFQ18823.1 lipopolysaccharide transport system ATP-binding protein [Parafilimonas terrae]
MPTVIKVENLSKAYQIGQIGTGTLQSDFRRWYAKARGKEDPFLKIGETNDRTTKSEGDVVWSLKDINFEIEQGDAVGIIGRNGAGKSTLLKILSRVTAPTTGKITGNGRVASLLEVGTGFHPELTGRENIYLNGAILGMRKKEITHKFDEIVDFAGVERYIDTPVKRYSSGMYVRLAFAVAAHLESEILIVDEVLAVGDAEFQKKCLGKMGEVSKGEGKTVLFVSHNMAAVRNLCNKGIILKNGELNFKGTGEEAIDAYITNQIEVSKLSLNDLERRQTRNRLRFTDICFKDENGISKKDFIVGRFLEIEVSFIAIEELYMCKTLRVDVGINDIYGNRVTWASTAMLIDKIDPEKGSVSFIIQKILLNEGAYNVNLFCESNEGIEDWIENASGFNMLFEDFYKTGRRLPERQGVFVSEFQIFQ